VWSLLGTKLKMSSARHPQTDEQSECSIKTLEQYLHAFINYNQTNWDLLLLLAEFVYNSSVHSGTSLTPFQTTYGYQPHTLLALSTHTTIQSNVPSATDFITNLQASYHTATKALCIVGVKKQPPATSGPTPAQLVATTNLRKAQECMVHYANLHQHPLRFQWGQLVLLSTCDLDLSQFTSRPNHALSNQFIRLYHVDKVMSSNAYQLQLLGHNTRHPS
jgi:hypothetical protein